GNNLILALGELRTVDKKNKVVKLQGKEKSKVIKKHKSISTESAADFQPELDVRGMRTEDALRQLETVLDRAVMIGYPSLKILHGKGDGIRSEERRVGKECGKRLVMRRENRNRK